jgi:hypothetical protein
MVLLSLTLDTSQPPVMYVPGRHGGAEGAKEMEETEGTETDERWLQLMCYTLLPLHPVFQSARQSGAESWTELTGNSRRQG